ncbi:MAG: glycosyltransferase family 4 protein [Methanobacterium sp.]|uniref:glycosyltransferase family 4 protein n=1 Tax=Methanobacterium sp. TaxID=2164 RepID=UPI003D65B0C2|nr:glycosyltransferase family 4 protein [Methanobacterium sp.]
MKILVVCEVFYPRLAGGQIVLWNLLNALALKGHKIYVVTGRIPDTVSNEEINGIHIFRPYEGVIPETMQKGFSNVIAIVKRLILMIKLYFYLNKFTKEHDIDIVYNMGPATLLPASLTSSKNNIPSVNSIHSLIGKKWFEITNPIIASFNYLGEIILIRMGRFSVIHCPSDIVSIEIKKHTSSKITVIPNPIDLNTIERVKNGINSINIKKELKLNKDEKLLLYVGSIIKIKNIPLLIKALSGSNTKFKLLIVGDGPERPNIEKLVKELDMDDKVLFYGQMPYEDTLNIINSSDILILPSKSEILPNVVLEALALDKPVIATKVGDIPNIKSENLYLVDEVEEIKKLIGTAIQPKEDNRIIEDYSLDRIAKKFEDLFYKLIKKG